MDTSPSRRRLFQIITLCAALVIACAIAEVGLRLCGYSRSYVNSLASFHQPDARLGYCGKPDFTGRFFNPSFDVTISHNELGFRRHEWEQEPRTQSDRVFVLGDSFVWGWGVGQGKVLTDQMNRLLPGTQVKNYGLNGSGTVQQYGVFQAHVRDQLQPGNCVIVNFYDNDFDNSLYTGKSLQARAHVVDGVVTTVDPRPRGGGLKDLAKDASCLFNLVVYCADRMKLSLEGGSDRSPGRGLLPCGDVPDGEALVVVEHYLQRFKHDCESRGARFMVTHRGNSFLHGCAERGGIESLDLLPFLREAVDSGRFSRIDFPKDAHWNESGHLVVAEAIAQHL